MLRTHGKAKAAAATSREPHQKISSPAEIRVRRELAELDLPTQCRLTFPHGEDQVLVMRVSIKPDDGFWKGGTFYFSLNVPASYPHDPPKVRCETQVYHPNIDLHGAVCLNILRTEWKPILSLYAVIIGLLHLFLSPEVFEPLNQDAATELSRDKRHFAQLVRSSIRHTMES